MRDALDTPRTYRYTIAGLLTGRTVRTAELVASIAACIAAGGLTAIDTATFGLLSGTAADDSCSITATDTTVTSPNNPWTAADVGKVFHLAGAGAAGGTLVTTIASYTGPGEVELANAASTTVAASKNSAGGLAAWGAALTQARNLPVITNAAGTEERAAGDSETLPSGGTTSRELGVIIAKGVGLSPQDFGAAGDGVTNDTAAFVACIAACANGLMKIPAGTYLTGPLTISAPITIHTAGLATRLKATATSLYDFPAITISASDVTIGDLYFIGNIALDTGEFNHCIAIQKGTAGAMYNIRLGLIYAKNVRGDGLYIGGTPTALVRDVTCAGVIIDNCLRSGVSVCGGEDIVIGYITGGQYGYRSIDVEPNGAGNQVCNRIHVGWIKGGRIQFAGDVANPIGTCTIDKATLDGTYQTDSVPPYASYDATTPATLGAEFERVHICELTVSNFSFVPCFFGGTPTRKGILQIDRYVSTATGTAELVYKAQFVADGLAELLIGGGSVAAFAVDRAIAKGAATTRYNFGYLGKLTTNGFVVGGGSFSRFRGVVSACAGDYPYQAITDSVLEDCEVTACAAVFYDCDRCRAVGGSFVYSVATDAAGSTKLSFERATVGGLWRNHWATDGGYTEAIQLASNFVWVDPATNKVFVKASAPANNTDGTIVGTQS